MSLTAIDPAEGDLQRATAQALGPIGPLAKADPAFVEREAQQKLAQAVAHTLIRKRTLVAEAGTGVGKTFAYLVPLLLSQQRALISTATKALQDQLFLRDLPRLRDALQLPLRLALLKGRSSYLCQHRLQQARAGAALPDRFAVRQLARIEQWAPATQTGDLAEVEGLDERSPIIALVTSTRDNCLGGECPEFRHCHVMKARREAVAADVVVVNHHLFFADLVLREGGMAELLPTVDAAVFDEAHQLVETGVQFLGKQLSSGQMIDFVRDLLAIGLAQARGLQPWSDVAGSCEQAVRQLRLACAGPLRDLRGMVKLGWGERAARPDFATALDALADRFDAVSAALQELVGHTPDLARLADRAGALASLVRAFATPVQADRVRWIDLGAREVRLVDSPLDIRELLTDQRGSGSKAWIFTSATLGDDPALSWFCAAAALEEADKLRVDSPFDYASQARFWVPDGLPRPNEPTHAEEVGALAGRLAARLNGRTFVLTTTLRVLAPIAQALRDAALAAGRPLDVLVQGSEPRRTLLRRFLARPGSVLVGSQSFWEGIDVPGDALQCVVIDKLPFPPPNDPLVQARSRRLEAQGRDPFNDYFVAEAAVSLKQGAGRLIRHETDRGLLVVCDVRMLRMGYGARLRRALPPMQPIHSEVDALAWLDALALDHV